MTKEIIKLYVEKDSQIYKDTVEHIEGLIAKGKIKKEDFNDQLISDNITELLQFDEVEFEIEPLEKSDNFLNYILTELDLEINQVWEGNNGKTYRILPDGELQVIFMGKGNGSGIITTEGNWSPILNKQVYPIRRGL